MENKEAPVESNSVSPRLVGFYFVLLTFFAPAFILIWWIPPNYPVFEVWGMVWQLYYSLDYGGWYLENYWIQFIIAHSIGYTFLRPVFTYQMVRLYQGKSDRQQTLLVGLFIEMQALIIDVSMILISKQAFYSIHLPIPLLLLAGVIVMKYKAPIRKTKSWMEDEQERSNWWGSDKKDNVKTQFLKGVTLNKILGTVLITEIILFVFGGLVVHIINPWLYQSLYEQLLLFYILITGLLFLMTFQTKK